MIRSSLENEIYTGRFDDGLLDLCVGVGLLGAGLAWLSEHFALVAAMPAVLIPLWIALRRQITEPRLGRVDFAPDRREAERVRLAAAAALGVGAFTGIVAWVRRAGGAPESLAALAPLVPAVLLSLGLLIVSAILGAGRFLAYALALAALAALTTWLDGEPWLYLLLGGALLSLWAASVFARFLATHPNLERE
jgi:hypothetical protein